VADKYVSKSLEVCFTNDWFDNHDNTMQEVFMKKRERERERERDRDRKREKKRKR